MLEPSRAGRTEARTPPNDRLTAMNVALSSKPLGPFGSTLSNVGLNACTRTSPTTTSQEGQSAREAEKDAMSTTATTQGGAMATVAQVPNQNIYQ